MLMLFNCKFFAEIYVEESFTVVIFNDLTLQCESSTILTNVNITYKWHRIGGSIPAKSIESDSGQLTIPRVAPEDQGEYYCTAILLGHCAESNYATVTVDGKKIIPLSKLGYINFIISVIIQIEFMYLNYKFLPLDMLCVYMILWSQNDVCQ